MVSHADSIGQFLWYHDDYSFITSRQTTHDKTIGIWERAPIERKVRSSELLVSGPRGQRRWLWKTTGRFVFSRIYPSCSLGTSISLESLEDPYKLTLVVSAIWPSCYKLVLTKSKCRKQGKLLSENQPVEEVERQRKFLPRLPYRAAGSYETYKQFLSSEMENWKVWVSWMLRSIAIISCCVVKTVSPRKIASTWY